MSLEAAIQENTAALKQLIGLFGHIGQAVAPAAPSTPPADVQPAKDEAKPTTPAPKEAGGVKYDDVKAAALKLAATKGKAVLMEVYGAFGVDHGSKLKPEQFADVLAKLQEALK